MSDAANIPYGAMVPPAAEQVEPEKEPIQTEAPAVEAEPEKAPMDYEKSYQELHKKFGEHSNQVGELRKQNQMLSQQVEQIAKQSQVREEKARDLPPPTDYEKMIRDVAKKVDTGDMSYEDGLVASNKITREWTKAEAAAEKESLLEQVRNEASSLLQAKDSEQIVSKFHEKNPDFQSLQGEGRFEQLKAEDPLLDDLSAYWKHQALTAGEREAAAFERGKMEAQRVAGGSAPAAKVLSDPGNSMQTQQKSSRPMSEQSIKESMLAAIS